MVLNTSFNENEPVVCKPAGSSGLFLADENGCVGDRQQRYLQIDKQLGGQNPIRRSCQSG